MTVTDAMVDAVVDAEQPYFRRLNRALRRHGFTVAAHLTEHQFHQLRNEVHSGCHECMEQLRQRA